MHWSSFIVKCNCLSLCVNILSIFSSPLHHYGKLLVGLSVVIAISATFPGYEEFHPHLHMQSDFLHAFLSAI